MWSNTFSFRTWFFPLAGTRIDSYRRDFPQNSPCGLLGVARWAKVEGSHHSFQLRWTCLFCVGVVAALSELAQRVRREAAEAEEAV